MVAARWKALTDEEKMVYQTKAKQDRVRYARELTLWQKQQDDIQRAEELHVAMGKLEQGNDTNPDCSSPQTSFREGQSVEPLKQNSIGTCFDSPCAHLFSFVYLAYSVVVVVTVVVFNPQTLACT